MRLIRLMLCTCALALAMTAFSAGGATGVFDLADIKSFDRSKILQVSYDPEPRPLSLLALSIDLVKQIAERQRAERILVTGPLATIRGTESDRKRADTLQRIDAMPGDGETR